MFLYILYISLYLDKKKCLFFWKQDLNITGHNGDKTDKEGELGEASQKKNTHKYIWRLLKTAQEPPKIARCYPVILLSCTLVQYRKNGYALCKREKSG